MNRELQWRGRTGRPRVERWAATLFGTYRIEGPRHGPLDVTLDGRLLGSANTLAHARAIALREHRRIGPIFRSTMRVQADRGDGFYAWFYKRPKDLYPK